MCELTVYTLKGGVREKVMESVVRLMVHDGKVILENGRSTLVDETALLQGAQAQTLQLMERRKDFAHTLVPMV